MQHEPEPDGVVPEFVMAFLSDASDDLNVDEEMENEPLPDNIQDLLEVLFESNSFWNINLIQNFESNVIV